MDEEPVVLASAATAGLAIDPVSRAKKHSYRDILKTSAMIGGSSVINLSIGMVRTKIMAVLLGPAGYGVMGAYILISELASRVAQMGLNASGVRQIAQSDASKDAMQIARTVTSLRRTSIACGMLGAIALAVFSRPISTLTFGTSDHASSVAWLSLVVLVSVVAGSQSALLQGMRRIRDIARLSIVSSLLSTAIGIPLIYVLGTDGLVPNLVAVATLSLAASWWYSRKIKVSPPALSLVDWVQESTLLLKLGVAFMASAMLMVGAAYAVRIIVLRKVGLDAAGAYYAAWTMGGLYIGLVLQALGTDCYPRLVRVAYEDQECNRLVNEQAQVSLLLAVPGVLITLTLAPLVISLFYSAKFFPAVDVLRWICLGMAMRVLTWPIGFIVVAKNKQALFFAIDLAWTVVNIGLSWWCVEAFGVNGAGIAFFGSYIFHGLLVYPIVRRLSGFRWTAANIKTATCSFIVIACVFIGMHVLPPAIATTFGIFATIASSYVSIRLLVHLVSPERLPRPIAHFLQLGRLAR